MDQRERYLDFTEVLRTLFDAGQAKIWTCLPAVIVNFPSASGLSPMIADVQPTINGRILTPQGTFQSVQMPVLLDCPVQFPSGGGVTLTFPLVPNDEVLVLFSARCIDAWFQQGWVPGQAGIAVSGQQPMDQPDLRMHDLSDGFVLPGVKSVPKAFTPSASSAQLQSNDGQAYVALNPTTHAITVSTTGNLTLNGVTIDNHGNVTLPTGADLKNAAGTSLTNHEHSGVATGSGTSGPPVPGS